MLAVLAGLTLIGAVLRLRGLGNLALIIDEGYQSLATRGILEHGFPLLDSGVVYLRSPIFLYLEALSGWLFGLDAFSLRLPAALFGAGCIPVAYLLGRELLDWRAGLVLAALVAFSAFHIELSRYARFYTGFQLSYMLALIAMYRGFAQRRVGWQVGFFALAALTIIFHRLGVMLGFGFLLFLPLRQYSRVYRAWCVGAMVLVVVLWQGISFVSGTISRALETTTFGTAPLAEGGGAKADAAWQIVMPGPLGKIDLTYIGSVWDAHGWLVVLIAALGLVGCVAAVVVAARKHVLIAGFFAVLAVVAAGAFLGPLAGFAIITLIAFHVRAPRQLMEPIVVVPVAGAAALIMVWGVVLKMQGMAGLGTIFQMLRYPDVHLVLTYWLWYGWLPLVPLLLAGMAWLTWRAIHDPEHRREALGAWFLLGVFLLPLLGHGALEKRAVEARYMFHLYPLVLLICLVPLLAVVTAGAKKVRLPAAGGVGVAAAVILLCLVVKDFNPATAWAVSSRTYGSKKDIYRSVINWRAYADFHLDAEAPAEYLNDHWKAGDTVISIGHPHRSAMNHFYTRKLDFAVTRPEIYVSTLISDSGRGVDYASGAELIWTADEIREVLRESRGGTVWVLLDTVALDPGSGALTDANLEAIRALAKFEVLRGRDGVSLVARIDPDDVLPPILGGAAAD